MGTSTWAVPVGVLTTIVVVSLIFVWIWFPRAWVYGTRADARDVEQAGVEEDGDARAAARAANRERARMIIARGKAAAEARSRGEAFNFGDMRDIGHETLATPPRIHTPT